MTPRASRNSPFIRVRASAILATLSLSVVFLLGCGEDGFTPDCPELPAYDVSRDPTTGAVYRHKPGDPATRLSASEEQQITDAVNAGCITGPGNASSLDVEDL